MALAAGVDIRGDGGFIVAPPSLHASGRRYRWDLSAHPEDTPLAPIPGWLLSLIQASRPTARATATGSAELHLPVGRRNAGLFRLACSWRRQGLGRAAIREMLTAVSRHHVAAALDAHELDALAASVVRYPPWVSADDLDLDALIEASLAPGTKRAAS